MSAMPYSTCMLDIPVAGSAPVLDFEKDLSMSDSAANSKFKRSGVRNLSCASAPDTVENSLNALRASISDCNIDDNNRPLRLTVSDVTTINETAAKPMKIKITPPQINFENKQEIIETVAKTASRTPITTVKRNMTNELVEREITNENRTSIVAKKESTKTVSHLKLDASTSILETLPDELLMEVSHFLEHKDQLMLCIAANKQIPRVWGIVLGCFSRSLKEAQRQVTEYGHLTEFASEGQKTAQEEWFHVKQQKGMLLHDERLFERNEGRFRVDLHALECEEEQKLRKFEVCVEVLKKTMDMWREKGNMRDKQTERCTGFFKSVKMVFSSPEK